MAILNFIMTYPLDVGLFIVIVVASWFLCRHNASRWLVYAVEAAESYFGSGTGKLKLDMAYDMFKGRFPIFSNFITKALFNKLVDKALVAMRKMIAENEKIKNILVEKEENTEDEEEAK